MHSPSCTSYILSLFYKLILNLFDFCFVCLFCYHGFEKWRGNPGVSSAFQLYVPVNKVHLLGRRHTFKTHCCCCVGFCCFVVVVLFVFYLVDGGYFVCLFFIFCCCCFYLFIYLFFYIYLFILFLFFFFVGSVLHPAVRHFSTVCWSKPVYCSEILVSEVKDKKRK